MKLTRRRAIAMYNATSSTSEVGNPTVKASILRNRWALEPIFNVHQEITKPSTALLEYDTARVALCRTASEVEGVPVIENNNYIIAPDKKEAFDKDMAELSEKYKEALTINSNKPAQIEEYLDGEEDINIIQIPFTDLLASSNIPVNILDDLHEMIAD